MTFLKLTLIGPVFLAMFWFAVPANAATAACTANIGTSLDVPVIGDIYDIFIDDQCQYVYATNMLLNRVEVFSLQTLVLGTPIQVGSLPTSLDASPDGSTLYVANSGGTNISLISTAQHVELRKVTTPSSFSNDTPWSLAVAQNGLVFISTTFDGSGFGGHMLQYDPVADTVIARADFGDFGANTEVTRLKASADRSVVGIIMGDISSGPVYRYYSASNVFSKEKDLAAFVSSIALDSTGAVFLVDNGGYVLDSGLSLSGRISGVSGSVAVDPNGVIGYAVSGGAISRP